MSITKKTPAQLQELQDTLVSNPHIEEVHFTKTGDHYFNKHELIMSTEKGAKPTGKFYGHLKHDLVVSKIVGERKFFKHASVAEPSAEIVETLGRDEILAMKSDQGEKLSKKDQKALETLQQENEALKAKLAEAEKK